MADRHNDDPNLKTAAVRASDALDKTVGAAKSVFAHATNDGNLTAIILTTVGIVSASAGGGLIAAYNQDFPDPQIIPVDTDLSGSAYMHRTYGYNEHDNGYYMLTVDEGLYQLYQWNNARGRLEFIENADVAKDLVSEIRTDLADQLEQSWYQDLPDRNDTLYTDQMYSCTTLKEPFETSTGILMRSHTCSKLEGTGSFLHSQYPEALEFWASADEAMTNDNYGHGSMTIHQEEIHDLSHIKSEGHFISNFALAGLAAWLGFGAIGASATGIRRRAEQDKRRALENARGRTTGRRP